jgi:hypothetical protein
MMHFSSYDQIIRRRSPGRVLRSAACRCSERQLADRQLVAPFRKSLVSPRGYCVIVSTRSAERPEVRAFVDWLVLTAAPRAAARGPGSARQQDRARP